MSKRVVFYNTYEPVVSLFRELPKHLQSEGIDVELVVSKSQYRHREIDLEQYFQDSGVLVRRIGLNMGSPVTSRSRKTIAMISYSLCAIPHVLFKRADLRIFLTQPPFFALFALVKRRFCKEPYACVLMDLYPEILEANGWVRSGRVVSKFLRSVALRIHKGAAKLIVIGKDMQSYIESTGVPTDSIVYIPNWASNESDQPIANADNILRSELGFNVDDFVVLYSGNMGVSHLFSDILLAAKSLTHQPAIKFVFIGAGPRRHEVVEYKNNNKLDNISLFDYQPAERLTESLSIGDIHFVSLRDGFGGVVVPSKIFGALSAGRPILFQGSRWSEVSQLLINNECGSQVDPGDSSSLVAQIERYYSDHQYRTQQANNAFIAYQQNYSSAVGIDKYIGLIKQELSR